MLGMYILQSQVFTKSVLVYWLCRVNIIQYQCLKSFTNHFLLPLDIYIFHFVNVNLWPLLSLNSLYGYSGLSLVALLGRS